MKNQLVSLFQNIIKSFEFLFLFLIRLYQVFISSFSTSSCKYIPSCSCYAHSSIAKFGPFKGLILTVFRITKCHPFASGGMDPVPNQFNMFSLRTMFRGNND